MYLKKTTRRMLAVLLTLSIACPLFADEKKEGKSDQKQPDPGEMMAMMMELAKPGENHKRMQDLVGTWSYQTKWWMSPESAPNESSGTMTSRSVMDGRYLISEHTGKMQMPGPDGKMMDMEFKGMAVEGYDNAKKKYVASWIDNMGTGIMNLEGTYDPATKALTYYAEYEVMPGMKMKMHEVVTKIDDNHRKMEFFEDRGGKEVKTMQIQYTRKS